MNFDENRGIELMAPKSKAPPLGRCRNCKEIRADHVRKDGKEKCIWGPQEFVGELCPQCCGYITTDIRHPVYRAIDGRTYHKRCPGQNYRR